MSPRGAARSPLAQRRLPISSPARKKASQSHSAARQSHGGPTPPPAPLGHPPEASLHPPPSQRPPLLIPPPTPRARAHAVPPPRRPARTQQQRRRCSAALLAPRSPRQQGLCAPKGAWVWVEALFVYRHQIECGGWRAPRQRDTAGRERGPRLSSGGGCWGSAGGRRATGTAPQMRRGRRSPRRKILWERPASHLSSARAPRRARRR
eukprot:PRCOL_00001798-RA